MAKNIEPKLKKIGDYLKLEEDTVFTILSPLYTDGKAEAKTRRLRAIIYNPSIAFEPVLWYNKLTDGFGCCCRRKGEFQWYQDT